MIVNVHKNGNIPQLGWTSRSDRLEARVLYHNISQHFRAKAMGQDEYHEIMTSKAAAVNPLHALGNWHNSVKGMNKFGPKTTLLSMCVP